MHKRHFTTECNKLYKRQQNIRPNRTLCPLIESLYDGKSNLTPVSPHQCPSCQSRLGPGYFMICELEPNTIMCLREHAFHGKSSRDHCGKCWCERKSGDVQLITREPPPPSRSHPPPLLPHSTPLPVQLPRPLPVQPHFSPASNGRQTQQETSLGA